MSDFVELKCPNCGGVLKRKKGSLNNEYRCKSCRALFERDAPPGPAVPIIIPPLEPSLPEPWSPCSPAPIWIWDDPITTDNTTCPAIEITDVLYSTGGQCWADEFPTRSGSYATA